MAPAPGPLLPPREPRAARWLSRRGLHALGVVMALVLASLLALPDPGPLPKLRALAFDGYQQLWPRPRASQPAVIVAVDDASLAELGQWPWPRDRIAALVDRVAARGPAVVCMDLLFSEPDRTSPEQLADALARGQPALAAQLRALPRHDAVLGEALARVPSVLGIAGDDHAAADTDGLAPARVVGADPSLARYRGALRSRDEIDAGAAGRGLFNAELDDGVVRRVPMVAEVGDFPVLALPLECLRVAAGEPGFSLVSEPGRPLRVAIGDLAVPVQDDGRLYVRYAGHAPARYLSAREVLAGRDDPDRLAGRVALIGVTGQGLVDQQLIPNGERIPGVEVHAEVLENVFDGALLRRPAAARGIELAAFLAFAVLAAAWVPRVSPLRSALLLLAAIGLLPLGGVLAFRQGHWLLDPLTPLLALGLLHASLVLATMMALEFERRRLAFRLAREREAAARTAGELEAGRRIQTGMLPRPERVLARERRVSLFAHMRPAREVGGDLYDFFALDDRRLFAVVGDVAGKGLAAAMFMAVSKALTKSSGLRGRGDLGELLEAINIELSRDNPDDLFVTLLAVVLDLDSGAVAYCNAGHEPLLLRRADGSVLVLDEGGGPPLCVAEFAGYQGAKAQLAAGDVLVLASDGLTEATDPEGALFGRGALRECVAAADGGDVDALGRSILGAIAAFEAGAEPGDDQTLLMLRWNGPARAG